MNTLTRLFSRNRLSCNHGFAAKWSCTLLAVVLGPVCVVAQPKAVVGDSPATAPVAAAWQDYDLQFHYAGFTSYYTCTGLEDRLEQILKEMGAARDVRVSASGCFGGNDISNMLSAHIRVRMPAVAADAAPQTFAAANKTVNIKSRRMGEIGAGDCELLEAVRDQLLPKLKLQLVKDGLHCVPGQALLSSQTLQVQALIAEVK